MTAVLDDTECACQVGWHSDERVACPACAAAAQAAASWSLAAPQSFLRDPDATTTHALVDPEPQPQQMANHEQRL